MRKYEMTRDPRLLTKRPSPLREPPIAIDALDGWDAFDLDMKMFLIVLPLFRHKVQAAVFIAKSEQWYTKMVRDYPLFSQAVRVRMLQPAGEIASLTHEMRLAAQVKLLSLMGHEEPGVAIAAIKVFQAMFGVKAPTRDSVPIPEGIGLKSINFQFDRYTPPSGQAAPTTLESEAVVDAVVQDALGEETTP